MKEDLEALKFLCAMQVSENRHSLQKKSFDTLECLHQVINLQVALNFLQLESELNKIKRQAFNLFRFSLSLF